MWETREKLLKEIAHIVAMGDIGDETEYQTAIAILKLFEDYGFKVA